MSRWWILPAFVSWTVSSALCQDQPKFQWFEELDSSGLDSVVGVGVDALGNTYIAGSTYSQNFPVHAALQNHNASTGLYRIDGPGSAYVELGLTSASAIAVAPRDPNMLYAISSGGIVKSIDGGATFSALPVPDSDVQVLSIDPMNDQIVYAGTYGQGILKSVDGGATWNPVNNGLHSSNGLPQLIVQGMWIDPTAGNILFATVDNNVFRSGDAGATWQLVFPSTIVVDVAFDPVNPGVLYVLAGQTARRSTDYGETFTTSNTPLIFLSILIDPNHAGHLLGLGADTGIFQSDDNGATWSLGLKMYATSVVADWANGFLYAVTIPEEWAVVRITADLSTVTPVGPPALPYVGGLAAGKGHLYVAVQGTRDVYVTKLDASGNTVYSTYFGGSADDVATAMAVDRSGNVYVTGTTTSLDFPVAKGAYASTGGSFLFRLNPDGTLGYSTYFAPIGSSPAAIAVDASGSAYLAGSSMGGLPVTPGAYQSVCYCGLIPIVVNGTLVTSVPTHEGFVSKFDPTAATLIYSTYAAGSVGDQPAIVALALASDGTVYVAGPNGIFRLNATGSAQLASLPASLSVQAMGVGGSGNLYAVGTADQFQTTAGAFETTVSGPPQLPDQPNFLPATVVAEWDPQLQNVVAATYFGGNKQVSAMAFDAAGNVYFGGSTAPQGLPTRTPLQAGFAPLTGFLSELSADLSTLLFSSYFGDTDAFGIEGIGVRSDGSVAISGTTQGAYPNFAAPMNIYVNSLALTPPPSLRVDSVKNAASVLDGAISSGETIVVTGADFGSNAQVLVGGTAAQTLSVTPAAITAVVPQGVPLGAAFVQAQSGGAASNQVLVPVTAASPGIFSQDGSGVGPGYILNKDGTLNTPSNPAAPGDPITIFATGVGLVSFVQSYAVTQFPVNIYINEVYANGITAAMGPLQGFPGSVFQILLYIPTAAELGGVSTPAGVIMSIAGSSSQNGIALSISQ